MNNVQRENSRTFFTELTNNHIRLLETMRLEREALITIHSI